MFAAIITLITSIIIISTKQHNDKIMTERAKSSAQVLITTIHSEQERLDLLLKNLIKLKINPDNAENIWNDFSNDTDYIAIYSNNNNLLWATDRYIEISEETGLTVVNNKLTIQASADTDDYTIVVGLDLSSEDFLDEIKKETGAEITLFLDNVRYGTTIVNNGERVIGTTMDDTVAEKVLRKRETYTAQTSIINQNHYVCYEPMININNEVIGAFFAGFSSKESDNSFTNVIIISVIAATLSIIVTIIVIVFIMKKMISEPINIINEISEEMNAGILNAKEPEYKFANDEIGQFANNLTNTKHRLNSIITDISNILTSMANGDFTKEPNTEYFGDFVVIKNYFEHIKVILGELISSINQSSSEVDSGALQMSNASQLLASGSVQQASAIEQLTATIEEFAQETKNCTNNTNNVHNLSIQSAEKIKTQENDINNLISAITDIKNKSEHISSIVKTIDDIAFQINILSLNATIEAARAGEAGKGFAVVANEVGNLANKSAAAVQEIENLINQTLNAISTGVDTVNHTVNSITEVAILSQEINTLIDEVALDINKEQEQINQISQGINQISEVVQQNSATAEETAASSEELSGQVSILKQSNQKLKTK
jgi:methyl-accepting chemotaxis protein